MKNHLYIFALVLTACTPCTTSNQGPTTTDTGIDNNLEIQDGLIVCHTRHDDAEYTVLCRIDCLTTRVTAYGDGTATTTTPQPNQAKITFTRDFDDLVWVSVQCPGETPIN